jgi:hypothetical protein
VLRGAAHRFLPIQIAAHDVTEENDMLLGALRVGSVKNDDPA